MKDNRWLILLSSLLINVCIGSGYAWSVFQKPLIAMFKWTTSEASLAFTLTFAVVPITMIIAGKIQDKIGPRKVIMVGALIFGCGFIGAGFASSLTFLYLTYGVLGGLGIGTVYATVVANAVKWFPDKRGLASGLVVAGFGSGAMVIALIAAEMIQGYGVLNTFIYLEICFVILIIVLAQLVHVAPAGFTPAGWAPPAVTATSTSKISEEDKDWKQMLTDPMFYVLFSMYTIACISGLMIIGHASPIGQELIKLTVKEAALAVSLLAMANTIGRIFWGWISDKIGRFQSCMAMYMAISAQPLEKVKLV
ncbi:MAG: MFS transporter, OFA family, oxalate/formate antiporter [Syntrophus sp. SKADARSKE-3]|nr:MFS transporter, OFA family, oxalate/formate antiporter [Syntrophus sp. SKADARSKE-3]